MRAGTYSSNIVSAPSKWSTTIDGSPLVCIQMDVRLGSTAQMRYGLCYIIVITD